jgi:hypothetical protein
MTTSAADAERSTLSGSEQPELPFTPSLRCALTHWYELRPVGQKLGSDNHKRLAAVTSWHRTMRRQGIDGLRGAIVASVKVERSWEAPLLPIGAALFQDVLPLNLVLRNLRSGPIELRSAAIFASVFYFESPLSVEIAEQVIVGQGDSLMLQAMKEALDIRSRTSTGGSCARCGARGVQNQSKLDWLPHRMA